MSIDCAHIHVLHDLIEWCQEVVWRYGHIPPKGKSQRVIFWEHAARLSSAVKLRRQEILHTLRDVKQSITGEMATYVTVSITNTNALSSGARPNCSRGQWFSVVGGMAGILLWNMKSFWFTFFSSSGASTGSRPCQTKAVKPQTGSATSRRTLSKIDLNGIRRLSLSSAS